MISRGEDEVLPNRFRASLSCSCSLFFFVLCLLLHRAPVQGFEEARAVRGTPRVRPAAPPTCFPLFLCVETYRDRHLFAALFVLVSISFVPIAGCNPCLVVCSYLLYTYTYSLLHLSVSALCVFSALKGRVPVCDPAQPSVLCLNRFSVQSVISPSPFTLSLAFRFKTPAVPSRFYTHLRNISTAGNGRV